MPDCEITVLVPHPDRPALLTLAEAPDRLPSTTIAGEFRPPLVLEAIATRLGVRSPLLRMSQCRSDADGEPTLLVVDVETIGHAAPDGLAWTDWATLILEDVDPPELRTALPRWIDRKEHGPTPTDPPWAIPGWFDRASRWMTAQMAALGTPATAPPTVFYSWGISMVLRAPTSTSTMYLKCAPSIFAMEPVHTALLAERTPEDVTAVAAIEPTEQWLLMRDHGDAVLGDQPASEWAPGLDTYARVQRAWMSHTDELARAGVERRTLAALAAALPTMADREPLASELPPEERARWDAAQPGFARACERLDRIGPAPTVLHGDLHPWNVAATATGVRIFDWSDTSIAHPFLDLAVYTTRAKDPAVRRALRDAYLDAWSDVLSPSVLAEAGELAIVVGTLLQVESYVRLLTALDPDDRGGMEGAARSWALAAVDTLSEGIDLRRPGHADG